MQLHDLFVIDVVEAMEAIDPAPLHIYTAPVSTLTAVIVNMRRAEAANKHTTDTRMQSTTVTIAPRMLTTKTTMRQCKMMKVTEQTVQVSERRRQRRRCAIHCGARSRALLLIVEGRVVEAVEMRTRRRDCVRRMQRPQHTGHGMSG